MPAAARDRLRRQLAPYRARHRDVRWTEPDSWHLTLLFLGAVAPTDVRRLVQLVERTASARPAYHVELERGGGRRRGADGVAWLELAEGADTLVELAGQLAASCPDDVVMGPPPRRAPSAHLTLVRRADDAVITALRERTHGPLAVGWTVDRLCLLRSHTGRPGARYETLHEATM